MIRRFIARVFSVVFLSLLIPGCKPYVAEPKSPEAIRMRLEEQYRFERRYLDVNGD